MFKLRYGYLISGIIIGCILLFNFIITLPDGKLHIIFCNVGQGDGALIKFPDGRDMVVDGGPNNSILSCLSDHLPFWQRHIDMVLLTHPQDDHLFGLISVFQRYSVGYFLRSDVPNETASYDELMRAVKTNHTRVEYMTRGRSLTVDHVRLSFLWPSQAQIAKGKEIQAMAESERETGNVLAAAIGDLNEYCLVFELHYGTFDALFTGDADAPVEPNFIGDKLADSQLEVLKVPHHGSKTGMTRGFVDWVRPKLAVISVGKNFFGQPAPEAINMLQNAGARVLRTDKNGDIEVISDGNRWFVK